MDIATTLLEYGAKADAESKAGFTPLHLSSQEGHTDMSTLLIEHQADTNHKAKVLKSFLFFRLKCYIHECVSGFLHKNVLISVTVLVYS
jgi:ankyrin repeat protein